MSLLWKPGDPLNGPAQEQARPEDCVAVRKDEYLRLNMITTAVAYLLRDRTTEGECRLLLREAAQERHAALHGEHGALNGKPGTAPTVTKFETCKNEHCVAAALALERGAAPRIIVPPFFTQFFRENFVLSVSEVAAGLFVQLDQRPDKVVPPKKQS